MKVSLVLGAGGARGYTHIGVIDELLARGHEIVSISGTSIGAVIGGAYAAGRLDQLREACIGLSKRDILLILQPQLGNPGLIKTDRIMAFLHRTIGDAEIQDLSIPYAAVATDVLSRREVWFRDGSLLAAIRASIAIPSIFSPVMMNGRLLADGGLLNPLPIEAALHPEADITIAVALFGKECPAPAIKQYSSPQHTGTQPTSHTLDNLKNALQIKKSKQHGEHLLFDPLPSDIDLLKMTLLSLDLMQDRIQASRLAVNPPDVFIDVPCSLGPAFDFSQAQEFISYGQELAASTFDHAGL